MKMLERLRQLRLEALGSALVMALIVFPFFRPASFFSLGGPALVWINRIYVVWKALSMLLIGLLFLAKPKLSPVTVVLAAYQVLLLVSTLVNHSDGGGYDWFNTSLSIGVLCVLADMAADAGPKALIKGILFTLGPLCLINLATVLAVNAGADLYPGRATFYFLSYDNIHGCYILPLLPLVMLYAWNRRWPFAVQIALLTVFTISIYITWTVSALVAATAFIALMLMQRIRGSWRLCNIAVYYVLIAAVFLLVVVFRVTEWFPALIQSVLHKDGTLSGRTDLWARCLQFVLARPILGNGCYQTESMLALVQGAHCHNLPLQILFNGGAVGLAVYMAALGLLVKPLMRVRASFGGYMLAAGFFSMLLFLESEWMNVSYPFYLLFVLCYHAEAVVQAMDPGPETLAAP